MSGSKGNGGGNGGGAQPIPAGSRKMVNSLKEIVNCPETEIYAALKECNMDPNEAVNRLLSQDPFHEVKNKREKKKEGKDYTESKSRGTNSNSSRGGKIGTDRFLDRGGPTPYISSDYSHFPGNSLRKKENGTSHASYLSPAHGLEGYGRSRGHGTFSDCVSAENKGPLFGANDIESSEYVLPSKSSWISAPGQISMADMLKMGRPYNNVPSAQSTSHHLALSDFRYSEDYEYKDPETGISSALNVQTTDDDWPSVEEVATATEISNPEYIVGSKNHVEVSGVPSNQIVDHFELETAQEQHYIIEKSRMNEMGSESLASRNILDDSSGDPTHFEDKLYKNMSLYQHPSHDLHEVDEVGESVSSISRNFQKLNMKDDRSLLPDGYMPSVVIPDHLQVHDADCSHLSFGSFRAGMSIVSSGTMASAPIYTNSDDERHSEPEISTVGHAETKSPQYYVDSSVRDASNGSLLHGTGVGGVSYDPSSVSQPETLKHESAELVHRNQYSFPSANAGYSFEDAQHLNTEFSQTSLQMQDIPAFSNVMSYTNSLPSVFAQTNAHPGRESDLQYSPFPSTQSMSAKYSVSSIGGSAIPSEDSKNSNFQQSLSAASGTSVPTGPPLPQHLPVHHPYSQQGVPLGAFANLIPYPFLAQSYTYMPSAFQQTYPGNNAYPQSLASVLPQYKNTVSPNSLPQSGSVASGYGAFGSNTTLPGNFQMNHPSATSLNYDDLLNSPYKDKSQLMSLLQNENSAQWLQGPNSRTMSAPNTYYNYPANHPSGGFRQAQQQPSQSYGTGYPNLYHTQAGGLSAEQPQNTRDSQGQPKQAQIWQGGY